MARLYRGYRRAEQRSAPTENAACMGGILVPAAWLPVDADLRRRRSKKPQPEALSACRATLGTHKNAACKGGIFVPADGRTGSSRNA
ncbi:hypothetical protein [Stenotrophomonas sp. TD3]|uniref:hypothetical protein n=1 Tax=Stenotrophomonas sp. TD3 TaxID=1641707 RepID=UPI0011152391|nr:hypothetical protein [Stenotrophomonas sp. TD3]